LHKSERLALKEKFMTRQSSSSGSIITENVKTIAEEFGESSEALSPLITAHITSSADKHATLIVNEGWRRKFLALPVSEQLKSKVTSRLGRKVKISTKLLLKLNYLVINENIQKREHETEDIKKLIERIE
jgi:hypothetical protein